MPTATLPLQDLGALRSSVMLKCSVLKNSTKATPCPYLVLSGSSNPLSATTTAPGVRWCVLTVPSPTPKAVTKVAAAGNGNGDMIDSFMA